MNVKKALFAAFCASVLFWTEASADSPYGWTAQSNEEIYASALVYLRSLETDLIGEPCYYLAQNLILELKGAHKKDPYVWMSQIHNFCNTVENIYAPTLSHPGIGVKDRYEKLRRAILRLRDYPIHQVSLASGDDYAPSQEQMDKFNASNKQWLQHKRAEFFDFLSGPRPTGGEIQVVKLYSSGYVFRTKNACIGMDICYEDRLYDSEGVAQLAEMLDVLYVTHAHTDHYDVNLMRRMLLAGKPVVMPKDIVPGSYNGRKYIWSAGQDTAIPIGPTKSLGFMSAQGTEPCLLYLVEIDGWRIIHVGDNSFHDNESHYESEEIADIVIAPIFQGLTSLLGHTKIAPNPKKAEQIYFNCHENEWKHTVERRVPYKYMYMNANSLGSSTFNYPSCAILDCGEYITLNK